MSKGIIKWLEFFLSLTIILNNFTLICAASFESENEAYDEAYVIFDKELKTKNINRVFMGSSENITVEERDNLDVWQITSSSSSSAYLYVDLSDEFGNSKDDGSTFDVEIEYYDQEFGYFIVWYDSADYGPQVGKEVYIKATNEWKTARFTLDNAGFHNGVDKKGDLMISTRELGQMLSASECNAYIRSIHIRKNVAVNPVYVESFTDESGNTFEFYKENKTVHNRFTNTTDDKINAEVTYRLVSESNFLQWSKTENIVLDVGEEKNIDVLLDTDHCGIYTYFIDVKEEKKGVSSTFTEDTIAIVKTDPNGIRSEFAWSSNHFPRYSENRIDECLELMLRANIAGTRNGFNWSGVETGSKKNYNIDSSLIWKVMLKCADLKLPFLYQFAFGNSLYSGNSMVMPETDEELAAWRDYCTYMTTRLKDMCDMYEVWNEPDLIGFNSKNASPAALAKITQIAAEVVHNIDPGAKVGGMSITGIKRQDRHDYWMKDALDADVLKGMDVLTLHTYAENEEPEKAKMYEEIKKYQSQIANYGVKNIPIWITETGNTSTDSKTTELNKSNWITRAAILFKANGIGDASFQYNFEKKGIIDIDREDNFGMVSTPYEKYNIEGKIGIPTKAYMSYAGMNYVLGGHIIPDGIFDVDENIKINRFKSEKFNKKILALWAAFNNSQVTLDLGVENVDYYDNYGNKTTIYGNNGLFTFMLDQRAGYIVGDFNKNEVVENSAFLKYDKTELSSTINDEIKITITDNTDCKYRIEPTLYGDAYVIKNEGFSNGVADIFINTGNKSNFESYIVISVMDGDKLIQRTEIPIRLVQNATASVAFKPASSFDYNRWKGVLTVLNKCANKVVKGYVRFTYPENFKKLSEIDIGYIPRSKTAEITFNAPEITTKGKYTVKYDLVIEGQDEVYSYDETVDFTMATYAASPPKIDGIIEKCEWPTNTAMFANQASQYKKPTDNHKFKWSGINDLSAKASIMWDEERLYIYSEVIDDIFYHNYDAKDAWKGDNIQFGLFLNNGQQEFTAIGQGGTNFHEFGLSLLPDGSAGATYRYKSQENNIPAGICKNAQLAILRNQNKTCYEWSMTWDEITGISGYHPSIKDKLGFSILWNDNDGDEREGWLEYASGIGRTKSRELFTYLYFVK